MDGVDGSRTERPRVLVVEDSETQAAWLADMLDAAGYEVVTEPNGLRALERIRERRPAILISDIDMPELDGFELCRRLKQDPALRTIPVVIVTHRDQATDLVRALEVGADNYLTKPLDPAQVVPRVRRIIDDVASWRERGAGRRQHGAIAAEDMVLSLERSQVIELLMATAQKLEEELGAVAQLGFELTMVRRLNQLLELLVLKVREVSAADLVRIFLHEAGAWSVRASSGVPSSPEAGLAILGIDAQLDLQALSRREPLHLRHDDGPGTSPLRVAGQRDGIVETYAFPLVAAGDPVGLLTVSFKERTRLTESEWRRFRHLADQAAVAVINARLSEQEATLRGALEDAYAAEKEAHQNAMFMLAAAVEARDGLTGAHLHRVRRYVELLAATLGLSATEVEEIGYSSVLHDVGKLLVPDRILGKPGSLTDEEWKEMRQHPEHGAAVLGAQSFFETARQIARCHHERWDGSGYPAGLAGEAIPLAARITSVADVFDALTTRRPYKEAWSDDEALAELVRLRGRAFDPRVVDAFLAAYQDGRIDEVRRGGEALEPRPVGDYLSPAPERIHRPG